MDLVVGDTEMLDAQVGKCNPQQLYGLDGNEQGPQADARILLFQRERRRCVGDGVRRVSLPGSGDARFSAESSISGVGNSEAAEVFLLSFSSLGRSR
jgi:hypothetical protein